MGSLSSVTGPDLGAISIKGAVETAGVDPKEVDEVFLGNVLQVCRVDVVHFFLGG